MPRMRFTRDHGQWKAGHVLEVSQSYAEALMQKGLAVDATTPVVQRAVAPQPAAKRTATRKV